MKHLPLASLLLVAACASTRSPEAARAGEYRSSKIDMYVGGRALDEDDWEPVEKQATLGLEFVHEKLDSTVGFEAALFVSEDSKLDVSAGASTADVTAKTAELSAGIRKTFLRDGRIHPYLGGGLAAIQAKLEADASTGGSASDDDTSPALYFHGGVDFDLGSWFLLGLDVRYLGGSDISLFGVGGDADYGQVALVIGFRF